MEEMETLVNEVIHEFYRRLEKRNGKQKLLLIGKLETCDFNKISNHYDIISRPEKDMVFDIIYISELTIDALVHIAIGMSSSPKEESVRSSLLEGKPVYLQEHGIQYRKYRNTASRNLYTVYQEYEKKLLQYGIKFITNADELVEIEQDVPAAMKRKNTMYEDNKDHFHMLDHTIDMTNKKLLSESDLINRHIHFGSLIELNKKCIITPMAYDFIKSHGLIIQKTP